jgi:hypothetical protein
MMDVFASASPCLTSVVLPRDAGDALKDRRSAAPPGDGFVVGVCRSMDAEDLSSGVPAAWCSGEGARSAGLLAGFASLPTRGTDVALRLDGCLWFEPSERPLGLHSVTRVPSIRPLLSSLQNQAVDVALPEYFILGMCKFRAAETTAELAI